MRARVAIASKIKAAQEVYLATEQLHDKAIQGRCCFGACLSSPQSSNTLNRPAGPEGLFALIQANVQTLWLLQYGHHRDSARTWLGLKVPQDTSIIQAKFYCDEQGNRSGHDHFIAILVSRLGDQDEIWLVDAYRMLREYKGRQIKEPRSSHAACLPQTETCRSTNICESVQLIHMQSSSVKVLHLTRDRSKCFYVSGCRGVACVIANPNFLTFYDLEEIDDVDSANDNNG